MYADVILPLPIQASFTYEVPESMLGSLTTGCRVLVQFGRSKIYTGIVENIHAYRPDFEPKEVLAQLDAEPIVRHPQLKYWQWIADYYLCTPGEVMKAALPAALKVESESWVEPVDDVDPQLVEGLTEKQALLWAFLMQKKRVRVSELEKVADFANPRVAINKLIDKGLVRMAEQTVNKYVSKKVTMVTLTCEREDGDALHGFFELVTRSTRQEKLLIGYLDLSGWMMKDQPLRPVEKAELLERTGSTPGILKALIDKGILKTYRTSINRFLPPVTQQKVVLPELSEPQNKALGEIRKSMRERNVTLLRGVTGSGKTEIYSHLMKEALGQGNHVLFLVPEISLTTQLTTRLQKIFGKKLLVYHSKFSDSERVDIWRRLLTSTEPMIVLGVRSSIFLPFHRIGLVIVDEEHESSYKQYDPAPRYNARDAAIMLATMHGAKVLLGSATPSIETYYKALSGKYGLVELLTRYGDVKLPEVMVTDMGSMRKQRLVSGPFSAQLLREVELTTKAENQSILFQNRRGYAPVVVCGTCGWTPKCENCDVSLVYHKRINELRCHYCGYTMTLPAVCPACGENSLSTFGYGTERVADTLKEIYPDLRISRMDLDTTRNKNAYEEIIGEFSRHETDVLVGTQMVSKGLDFRNVKLVSILNADTLLNFPDFRSNERAFNMMEQVAGRAGRHGESGKVLIQTTAPDNPIISRVVKHDYTGYYAEELEQRRRFFYPPFARVINVYLRHKDEHVLDRLTASYGAELKRVFGERVLGPETPYVSRVSNYYIRTFMLKIEAGASMQKVKELLRTIYVSVAALPGMKQLQLHYDVDPV